MKMSELYIIDSSGNHPQDNFAFHLLLYSQLAEGIFYITVTSTKQHPFRIYIRHSCAQHCCENAEKPDYSTLRQTKCFV